MRLPDFLSKWGILFQRLSGRYRRQNYLLPPEFGPSSNTETLGEILERTPSQDLQREVGKYILRKNRNLYKRLRDKSSIGKPPQGSPRILRLHNFCKKISKYIADLSISCKIPDCNGRLFQNYSVKFTNEPKYVDIRVFLELYKEMMETNGQKQYIRDMGLLESALHRPQWMFYYSEAQSISLLFKMAAALGESIIKNHAFLDGNKRAGHLAISMFLAINSYDLDADDESTEKIMIGVATGDVNIDILESWIASNVKKIE